jgi:hypothetical protein
MTPREQIPGDGDVSRPALSPAVWEKMREHVQDVAQQIAQSVQHAIVNSQDREKEAEAQPS